MLFMFIYNEWTNEKFQLWESDKFRLGSISGIQHTSDHGLLFWTLNSDLYNRSRCFISAIYFLTGH